MEKVVFDPMKLNKSDRDLYEQMTGSEKTRFADLWSRLETDKLRLVQQKNASRVRANRDRKELVEKERRERAHRLIERGAILESFIDDPLDFSSEEMKEIISKTIGTEYAKKVIEKIRERKMAGAQPV